MSINDAAWVDLERELQGVLVDGVDIGGTIEEADVRGVVAGATFGLTIELSDLEGADQAEGYLVLCDLLFTRRQQGVEQSIGCMVFATEPDSVALVTGLGAMTRENQQTVAVIPLSRAQAARLAVACKAGPAFLDDVSRVVKSAASSTGLTRGVADTLLAEIEEMVEERTRSGDS